MDSITETHNFFQQLTSVTYGRKNVCTLSTLIKLTPSLPKDKAFR